MDDSLKNPVPIGGKEQIILDGRRLFERQESVRNLREYCTFLREIGGQDEILSFIEGTLLKAAKVECYFGKKIYSVDDISGFYEHHKDLIDKYLKKIFLSARGEVDIKFYLVNKKKLRDMFDISLEIVRVNHKIPTETVEAWLNEADDDIRGARRDCNAGAYKKALNRLQLAVEVLIKAYALEIGLMTEQELNRVRHTPVDVYVDLLKQSWVVRAKNVFKLKNDINSSIAALEKMKVGRKSLDDVRKEALEWDKATLFFLNRFEKTNKKLRKVFSRRGMRYLLQFCEGYMDTKSYYKAWFGFSGLLLPLSVSTQYYSSWYSYPDISRKLDMNYEDMNLVKNLNKICYLLEENIKSIKKSLKQDRKFNYTYLCETLQYSLKDITHYYTEKEKLDIIKKTIGTIRTSDYVMSLVKKIQNSDSARMAESYGIN